MKKAVTADSEDKLFDVVDLNNIPNLVVPAPLISLNTTPANLLPYVSLEPYKGYAALRTWLNIADEWLLASLQSIVLERIVQILVLMS